MAASELRDILKQVLKPALKLLLSNSLRLPEILEMIKEVLIEVSHEELEKLGHEKSASRVSAMTGVHRRDIARLTTTAEEKPEQKNLLARVMVQWQHHPDFVTSSGKPRVLSCEGKHSDFARLVKSINGGDLSTYAVLFEMERLGIVEKTPRGLKLLWRDFSPQTDALGAYKMLAEDCADLTQAIASNVTAANSNLHLKTEFDRIDRKALPEIQGWLLEQGSKFHKQVRNYLSSFDADTSGISSPEHTARVAFAAFSLCEEQHS